MLDIGQDGCSWGRATIRASAVVTAEATTEFIRFTIAAFVTALTLGGTRQPVTGVGIGLQAACHDDSVCPGPPGGWDLAMHDAWGAGRAPCMELDNHAPCQAGTFLLQRRQSAQPAWLASKARRRTVLSYTLLARHVPQGLVWV